ncbi:hypothetical protein J0P97_08030 [Microbacterium flavum]|uniref:Uncharacterized protein n=1 Tax=Microbacterium flavum TaxID=415216 RepID=A0ABS5XTZ8_9MICO|nr:hypothetical protein [Microbacterium flavum]MBT8798017.1 hypothetical protein [Microbacterium flavum]
MGIVGVLLVGAFGAAGAVLYDDLYSPSSFVRRYLDLLSTGNAAEALTVPGVAVDSAALQNSGLPADASEALLRRAALAPLTHPEITSATAEDDGTTTVTVSYDAGPHSGTTAFRVERAGWVGVAPTWRFATSPLAAIELTVRGATQFAVNGFEVDTRQVSPDRADADPLEPVALLVFSPGLYSISVDTPIASTPGVAVLSDTPLAKIPVDVQAQPTEKFTAAVQEQVESFLSTCATQQVLQPTGCPFGLVVQNRLASTPTWSIAQQPTVTLVPDGAHWRIEKVPAVAHITVDIRSIFDGSVRTLDEAVPFSLDGTVTILPDGTASIQVGDGS